MTDGSAFSSIDSQEAVTLSVGWVSGRSTKLRKVAIGQSVADAFRQVIQATLDDLARREGQAWAPDADLSPETFLTLKADEVGAAPKLGIEHGSATLLEVLQAADALEAMKPDDLPAGDLSFYAITIGDVPGQRAVFIRRSNPRRGLKRGRIYSLLQDTLQRIDEPIFAFDDWMDLLSVGDEVLVLSQTVFAALFRNQDALTQQVPQWTSDLHEVLPIASAGQDRLKERALRDSRMRARLEAIVRRGHLATVTADTLVEAMSAAGLDAERLISSEGELILEAEDIAPVLYFLNEDLFTGALTQTSFRADKKAAR